MVDSRTGSLGGRRILIVEDDYLIASDLMQSLEDVGVEVVGPAGSVADALALIANGVAVDAAVLDINLGTEKVYPVADDLRRRGVSFVFASGYGDWVIPVEFASTPRFEKPINTSALIRALSTRGV